MRTRIFLVRHGATVLTAEDRFAGSLDVQLSDEGRAQSAHLAARLAKETLGAIYSSPLSRTLDTARVLAAPHGLDVIPRSGLREIAHGRWEGLTRAEVERDFAAEYGHWERDPFTFSPEGGETGLAVTARALPDLMTIVEAHPGQQVLVVSHKATIRLLLSSVLGCDPRRYRDSWDQSPAALNIIDFKDTVHARLTLFNDTSHYTQASAGIPQVPHGRLSKWWS
jgi:broad specificity phosphatase PhoE